MTNRAWSMGDVAKVMLAALILVMVPATSQADPPGQSGVVERAPQLSAWVLWDGDGLLVLTGPALEDGCVGEGFQFPVATTVSPPGTDTTTTYSHADIVTVYDAEGITDPLDWLFNEACAAIVAGEPGPEPLASGEGRVIYADGATTVAATVTTVDGRTVPLTVVRAEEGQFPDTIRYGG
jgi:hypothetical protein